MDQRVADKKYFAKRSKFFPTSLNTSPPTTPISTVSDPLMTNAEVELQNKASLARETSRTASLSPASVRSPGASPAKDASSTPALPSNQNTTEMLMMPPPKSSRSPSSSPTATRVLIASDPKKFSKKTPSLSKPQALITFLVGPEENKQTFVVHKDFATFHSPVFDKAFNLAFLEAERKEMRIEDISGEAFGRLVHWLYTKQIEEIAENELLALAELWTLAQRFSVVELQNHIMVSLTHSVKRMKAIELGGLMKYAYELKGDNSLKKLVVDKVAWDVEPEFMRELKENGEVPPQMWSDIAMCFSTHYWDRIPGKYFKGWGDIERYVVKTGGDTETDVVGQSVL